MNIDYKEKFENLVKDFLEKGGSDIHFSINNPIGFRLKGYLKKQYTDEILNKDDTIGYFNALKSYLTKQLQDYTDSQILEKFHAGFGIIACGKRFRVNIAVNNGGYYIVLRVIDGTPPKLENLNFTENTLNGLKWVSKREAGLFLVVGSTGSGKSTTLASIIRNINEKYEKNIVTLEDPIEFVHESYESQIVQKELGRDFLDFNSALSSALREDPNVLLIGEIRDGRTLDLAIKASETGHLVFGTLHTNDAIATIQRLSAMSSNPALIRDRISQTLLGVIAQKLTVNTQGKRMAVWELLICDKRASALIRENKDVQLKGALDTLKYSQSFNYTLREYFKQNLLTEEECLILSPDPKYLKLEDIETNTKTNENTTQENNNQPKNETTPTIKSNVLKFD